MPLSLSRIQEAIIDLVDPKKGIRHRAIRVLRSETKTAVFGTPKNRQIDVLRQGALALLIIAQNPSETNKIRIQAAELAIALAAINKVKMGAYVDGVLRQILKSESSGRELRNGLEKLLNLLRNSEDTANVGSSITESNMGLLISFEDLVDSWRPLRTSVIEAQKVVEADVQEAVRYLHNKSFLESEIRRSVEFIHQELRCAGAELLLNGDPARIYPRRENARTGRFTVKFGDAQLSSTVLPSFSYRFLQNQA